MSRYQSEIDPKDSGLKAYTCRYGKHTVEIMAKDEDEARLLSHDLLHCGNGLLDLSAIEVEEA